MLLQFKFSTVNIKCIIMNLFIYFRIRLISIASQKFIADISNDALQHCKMRLATLPSKSGKIPKDRKFTLTMEDLTPALYDHGIVVRKPPYFV